jgi:hypothetical protein
MSRGERVAGTHRSYMASRSTAKFSTLRIWNLRAEFRTGFADGWRSLSLQTRGISESPDVLERVRNLRASLVAEPRLTGVAVFRWGGDRFEPDRIYRNPRPGPGASTERARHASRPKGDATPCLCALRTALPCSLKPQSSSLMRNDAPMESMSQRSSAISSDESSVELI